MKATRSRVSLILDVLQLVIVEDVQFRLTSFVLSLASSSVPPLAYVPG